jgi:hypothetical protein
MRKLSAIALTFALVFFGIMVLSHVPRNLTAQEDMVLGRIANMTFFESSRNNIVEKDGIQFEAVISEGIYRIPPKQPGAKTQVQFGIRITNNTKIPCRFLLFFARPEFLQASKQKVPRFGPNVNGSYNPQLSDFHLVVPGESVTLLLEGYFQWEKDKLKFVFREKSGSYWIFSSFNPGRYSLRVIYENQYHEWENMNPWSDNIDLKPVYKEQASNNMRSDILKMEDVWSGEIITPPIEFQLIQ